MSMDEWKDNPLHLCRMRCSGPIRQDRNQSSLSWSVRPSRSCMTLPHCCRIYLLSLHRRCFPSHTPLLVFGCLTIDGTTSHPTRQPKNGCQVVGYGADAHHCKTQSIPSVQSSTPSGWRNPSNTHLRISHCAIAVRRRCYPMPGSNRPC